MKYLQIYISNKSKLLRDCSLYVKQLILEILKDKWANNGTNYRNTKIEIDQFEYQGNFWIYLNMVNPLKRSPGNN